jgi:hypothetical protein
MGARDVLGRTSRTRWLGALGRGQRVDNNAHSRPALVGLSGGLLILGLALWAIRLVGGATRSTG